MNHLVYTIFRGAQHGGAMGLAGFQSSAGGGTSGPPTTTLGPRPLGVARQNGDLGTGSLTLRRNPST